MKITTRLILSFLALSLFPLVMVGYIGWQAMDRVSCVALEESTEALKGLGEVSIHQKALDVAQQVALYLEAHPELLTLPSEALEADGVLASIAVQTVGETGYTAVYDSEGITHFHANPEIVGMDMHELAGTLPAFWGIFATSLDGTVVADYYEWQDADGSVRDKYMSCVPVGDTRLRVAATTYIDEFYRPIWDTESEIRGISRETQLRVGVAVSLVGGMAVLVAILMAAITIRPLNRIAEGARLFSQGRLDHEISGVPRDEIGQLAKTFNQMARELKKTLQEKDDVARRLQELNQRLEQMVAGRTAELQAANRDLKARQQELVTLQSVSHQISSLLSLDDILEQVMDSVIRTFGHETAAFFLTDRDTGELYPAARSVPEADPPGQKGQKISRDGPIGHVAASGEALLIRDVSEETRYVPPREGIRSGLYVPLLVGESIIGVFAVESTEYNAFSSNALEIVTALANQAAVAIQNAYLFESVRDQTVELAQMADNLAEEKSKLAVIFQNVADGLVVTNLEGRVVLTNPVFEAIVGQSASVLAGRFLSDLLSDEGLEAVVTRALAEVGQVFSADLQVGPWVYKASACALQPDGDASGVVTILRDITHEKAVDRMKTDFISMVSHELRTPLTSVLGFAKLISRSFAKDVAPQISDGGRKAQRAVERISSNLGIIVSEGERLTRLINDVLDIAKMEAGKIEWHMADLSVEEVVRDAVVAMSSLANTKNLAVKVEVEKVLPPVRADRDRLSQVVTNLLSNAIKFTDRGEIRVTCYRLQVDDTPSSTWGVAQGDWLAVSVQDTGIGIAQENLSQVFEKFKQVGDILTGHPKGTGLGLSICKEIVEHHGGRIWAESQLGVGSTFTFVLPLAAEAVSRRPLVGEIRRRVVETLPTSEEGQLILVVDDEENIRSFLRQELIEAGYRVIEAADGTEALGRARKEQPALVILDIMMPGISGFDVISVLRADPDTSDIPILVLSILEDKVKGFRLGADEYLTKPLDIEELLQAIAALLARAERGEGFKKVLIIDEDASLIENITCVLQERGYEVVEAYDGRDGLEKARREQPDLIILDAVISRMNDYEVLRGLKYEAETLDVSVIVLTAETLSEGVIDILNHGADRCGEPDMLLDLLADLSEEDDRRPDQGS